MANQLSQSGRIVTGVLVQQGNVYVWQPGATGFTATTNNSGGTPPLIYSGVVQSAANIQKLWFADGTNYVYYGPSTNSVEPWQASAGSLPVDSANNTPRLICTWRGRTVLSGLIKDSQNWFMSRIGVPTDFDYFPINQSSSQPIAGNNAPQGLVGDTINSLCPYSDDTLIFFGDNSIYLMAGDPLSNGHIDLVTKAIGGTWGVCWCMDPYGTVYFMSNRTGVYSFVPGQKPQRISQAIEQELRQIDTGRKTIRLQWEDEFQGFHLFATSSLLPTASDRHYFFEARTGSWWKDRMDNPYHNPVACCTFDGNDPGDRVSLIGSYDGYLRFFSADATDDDGTTVASSVFIGPLLTKDLDAILMKTLQPVFGSGSGTVTYSVHVGATAEEALASTAVATGTWVAGRNLNAPVRYSGHAIYCKLSSTSVWALEQIRAAISGTGAVRRRAH